MLLFFLTVDKFVWRSNKPKRNVFHEEKQMSRISLLLQDASTYSLYSLRYMCVCVWRDLFEQRMFINGLACLQYKCLLVCKKPLCHKVTRASLISLPVCLSARISMWLHACLLAFCFHLFQMIVINVGTSVVGTRISREGPVEHTY